MRTGRNFVCMVTLVGLLSSSGWGLEVLEPDYVAETYAAYSDPGIDRSPWDMVFVPDGNLYATQLNDRFLWKISPDGVAQEFVGGLGRPTGAVWAGGTAYGDYIYIAVTDTGILRVQLDATVEGFASRHCAGTLTLDRSGNYYGLMFTTTGCSDHTYVVDPAGVVALFSNWPTPTNGGGPHNIAVDNFGSYGNLLYIASAFTAAQPHVSGLFSMAPDGTAARFAPAIVRASGVKFDPADAFEGDMFVIGTADFAEPDDLWRVKPDGTATRFALLDGFAPRGMAFGPDGALYVGEYVPDAQMVIVTRISPYQPVWVEVDIKPGGCPNPLNLKSRGLLPVAILGAEDFDVNDIDIASIRLAGVAPVRSNMEDVTAPVIDGNECDCVESAADGFVDLILKFTTHDIVEALTCQEDDLVAGTQLSLLLTGVLKDGTPLEGADCMVIVGKVPDFLAARKSDVDGDGVVDFRDFATLARHWMEPAL